MSEGELTPQSSAAEQVQNIVWFKARALKDNGLAEIDYEVEVEDAFGNKVKDSGTIRAEPFDHYGRQPNDG